MKYSLIFFLLFIFFASCNDKKNITAIESKTLLKDSLMQIKGSTYTEYDKNGNIILSYTADKIELKNKRINYFRVAFEKELSLTKPVLTFFENNKPVLTISADNAVNKFKENILTFYNNVILESDYKRKIITSKIDYRFNEKKIITNEIFKLIEPDSSIIMGSGFVCDLNLSNLKSIKIFTKN